MVPLCPQQQHCHRKVIHLRHCAIQASATCWRPIQWPSAPGIGEHLPCPAAAGMEDDKCNMAVSLPSLASKVRTFGNFGGQKKVQMGSVYTARESLERLRSIPRGMKPGVRWPV
jgi:hypothetical protein